MNEKSKYREVKLKFKFQKKPDKEIKGTGNT